ncbi:hypothetical protein V8C42DRAFT_337977 [Trichoderma barbatum]
MDLACMNAVNIVFPLAQSLNKAMLRYCQPLFALQELFAAGAATARNGALCFGTEAIIVNRKRPLRLTN